MTAPPLWQHQLDAVRFIEAHGGRALLDMDMGTGKTRCAIEWCERQGFKRVLVLTPKVVIDHWADDFGRFAQRDWRVAALTQRTMPKKLKEVAWATVTPRQPAVVIVNPESAVSKVMARMLLELGFDALIIDESHRLKAPNGKQSKWVGLKLAPTISQRVLLTGTPMPHSPLDIFAQMRVLDPTVYGWSFWKFRNRYGVLGGYNGKEVVSYQNLPELQDKMRGVSFHVSSDDVLDLPEALEPVRVSFDLCKQERAAYTKVENEFEAEVADGTITVSNALVKLLRLQQLTGGNAHVETDSGIVCRSVGASKLCALLELLEHYFTVGDPIVVFFRFVDEIDDVAREAHNLGWTPKMLRGGCNELAEWQAGEGDLLLVQIQSGGTGVNLSRSHTCVFYSLGYSLGEYQQACKRLHRPGQTHAVSYYHLVGRNTVDVTVHRAIRAKEKVVQSVLAAVRSEGR